MVSRALDALEHPLPRRARSRSRRRRRRRSRESSSASRSRSSPSPTRRLLRTEAPLQQTAQRHPGVLTEKIYQHLRRSLSLTGPDSSASLLLPARSTYANLASSFLMTAYLPSLPTVPVAAAREMQTLAAALDFLMQGRLASATDIMCQRWRALEMSLTEGWPVARHLELLPPQGVSSLPSGLRANAVRQFRAEQRFQQARPGYPPPRRPPAPPNTHRWNSNRPPNGLPALPTPLPLPDARDAVRDPAAVQQQ